MHRGSGQIFDNPDRQFRERDFGRTLEVEGGAELIFAARSPHEEDQGTGHSKCDIEAQIEISIRVCR
jgi:hypothetical protein